MAIKKLTKKTIDSKISEILELQAKIKQNQTELKALVNDVEGQYKLTKEQRELITGFDYQAEKIPVNRGIHQYDSKMVRKMLRGITDKSVDKSAIVYKVDVVEYKPLENLVKTGHITSSMLDKARIDNYTFKTKFSHIEVKAEENSQSEKVSTKKSDKKSVAKTTANAVAAQA